MLCGVSDGVLEKKKDMENCGNENKVWTLINNNE